MSKKIKCLNIISNMNNGGAQKIILNYIDDLCNDKDIELSLLVFSSRTNYEYNKILEKYDIKITYLNYEKKKIKNKYIKRIYDLYYINKKTIEFLKENKPDIVHVHLFGTLLFCYKAINRCKIPIRFYSLHSNPLRFKNAKLNLLRKAFSNYRFIPICITNEQYLIAKKYYRFNRYEIIHNGINFDTVKRQNISKKEARKQFNLENKDYIISAVGRLDPIKKYDFLIYIFNSILKTKYNCKLIIAGDGAELDNLKYLVSYLNIKDKVIFLGNISNTTPLYCASDVLVITSESESSSLVLLEAQACNLKCIISNGVPSESIITNKVIKMKENSTVDDWVKAIIDGDNYEKKEYDFKDYEVHLMSKKMKEVYLKYYEEYQNGK